MSDEESHNVRKGMWKITSGVFIMGHIINNLLSHASAKTESENNRRAAQGTVTELHPAAH